MPQYRGAAPINWAVINGETETGVTTFFLDHDIDTGRIILKKTFPIPDDADVEYVYDGLMHLGAQLCLDTLAAIIAADGHPATISQDVVLDGFAIKPASVPPATPQDELSIIHYPLSISEALKPAPKIFKETCEISWAKTAKQVYDFVRGLSPIPGAWTTLVDADGKKTVLKIYKTRKTGIPGLSPGTITVDGKALCVSAQDELLEIVELQLAGKKRMAARDFLNGMKHIENYHVK